MVEKNVGLTNEQKRLLIEADEPALTRRQRCDLLGMSRSSYYYQPVGENPEDERLMQLLDQHYTDYPHGGKVKRALWLSQQVGYTVGRKRVARLMKKMGIATVYPKPNASVPDKSHEVYPYLLKNADISYPNQVWSAIT